MLLTEEQKRDLVNQIVEKARGLIALCGFDKEDDETGLVITECRVEGFIIIQHQRQKVHQGEIKTNGLDIWRLEEGKAVKSLSVNYIPFQIKHFEKAGKAPWIERFLNLDPGI